MKSPHLTAATVGQGLREDGITTERRFSAPSLIPASPTIHDDACGCRACINAFCADRVRDWAAFQQRVTALVDARKARVQTCLDRHAAIEAAKCAINGGPDKVFEFITGQKPKSAPQTTVEALIWSVREKGVAALRTATNLDRMKRLSQRQIDEVNARISRLEAAGRLPDTGGAI